MLGIILVLFSFFGASFTESVVYPPAHYSEIEFKLHLNKTSDGYVSINLDPFDLNAKRDSSIVFLVSRGQIKLSFATNSVYFNGEKLATGVKMTPSESILKFKVVFDDKFRKSQCFSLVFELDSVKLSDFKPICSNYCLNIVKNEEMACFKPVSEWKRQKQFPKGDILVLLGNKNAIIGSENTQEILKLLETKGFVSEYTAFQLSRLQNNRGSKSSIYSYKMDVSRFYLSNGDAIHNFTTIEELDKEIQKALKERRIYDLSLLSTILTALNHKSCF